MTLTEPLPPSPASAARPVKATPSEEGVRADLRRLLQARLIRESGLVLIGHPLMMALVVYATWDDVPHFAAPGRAPAAVPATVNAFGPPDLWTFYNQTPPLNGATDGSGGDCIALVEDSDFADAAVQSFSTNYNLPAANLTRVLADATNPGKTGDETEALLDIEYAHAIAPGAPITVYIGNSAQAAVDPIADGIVKAVSDHVCGAIGVSFVFCGETDSFYTGTLDPILAEAASQGQSVFAASGDWGSVVAVQVFACCSVMFWTNVNDLVSSGSAGTPCSTK
jgi:hypothetical protein